MIIKINQNNFNKGKEQQLNNNNNNNNSLCYYIKWRILHVLIANEK